MNKNIINVIIIILADGTTHFFESMPTHNDNNEYYIQDTDRKYMGRCMLFWKKNNNGYTASIGDAKLFTKAEAEAKIKTTINKNLVAWPKNFIRSLAEFHIDEFKIMDKDYSKAIRLDES